MYLPFCRTLILISCKMSVLGILARALLVFNQKLKVNHQKLKHICKKDPLV